MLDVGETNSTWDAAMDNEPIPSRIHGMIIYLCIHRNEESLFYFIAESTSFKDNFEACRPRRMQSAKLRIHVEHLTGQYFWEWNLTSPAGCYSGNVARRHRREVDADPWEVGLTQFHLDGQGLFHGWSTYPALNKALLVAYNINHWFPPIRPYWTIISGGGWWGVRLMWYDGKNLESNFFQEMSSRTHWTDP